MDDLNNIIEPEENETMFQRGLNILSSLQEKMNEYSCSISIIELAGCTAGVAVASVVSLGAAAVIAIPCFFSFKDVVENCRNKFSYNAGERKLPLETSILASLNNNSRSYRV